MSLVSAFPSGAPYRIDQVTSAPAAMLVLFLVQVLLAAAMSWAGWSGKVRLWNFFATALLLLVALFFTLASWGNSDTTKLSHYLAIQPNPVSVEPLWTLLAPLVVRLPYRMAFVQGLVAAGYGAAALGLARLWGVRAWAGWWALVITCSPMLRGFMQNAHTRQALAVLLTLPLLLHTSRLLRFNRRWLALGVLLSALTHNTFLFNLLTSLSPWLLRLQQQLRLLPQRLAAFRWRQLQVQWPQVLVLTLLLILLIKAAPLAMDRLVVYTKDPYFNSYSLLGAVGRLQWALALGLVLACLHRQLSPLQLLRCPLTQCLLLFGLLYLGIQQSIVHLWLPQVSSRLADGVAFFLLILYLAWINRYQAHWCLLPVIIVTFQYWLDARLLSSDQLRCGLNDDFLCLPDRWPWQVRY